MAPKLHRASHLATGSPRPYGLKTSKPETPASSLNALCGQVGRNVQKRASKLGYRTPASAAVPRATARPHAPQRSPARFKTCASGMGGWVVIWLRVVGIVHGAA